MAAKRKPLRPLATCAVAVFVHVVLTAVGSADVAFWAGTAMQLLVVFLTIPFAIWLALSAACAVAGGVLLAIAIPVMPFRRTGVGALLWELVALPAPIVPRYIEVVVGVRSPVFWGGILGLASAFVQLAFVTPPAA